MRLPRDADAIAAIYSHYVSHSIVTFELDPVGAAEMRLRIGQLQTQGMPWLIAEDETGLLGYAYAGRWRARPAYRNSVESSVYVADAALGRGIGRLLYVHLVELLESAGLHSVIAGVSLSNPASVALHEALGFEQVAHFRQVGFKFGRWIDVGYWQRLLPENA